MQKYFVSAFFIIILIAMTLSFSGKKGDPNGVSQTFFVPGEVKQTARVMKKDITESITETGTIGYRGVYNLFTETGGILTGEQIRIRDKVHKGDLLFSLKNDDLQKQAEKAKEDLNTMQQELNRFQEFTYNEKMQEIEISQKNLLLDQKARKKALEDAKESFPLGMISKSEMDKLIEEQDIFESSCKIKMLGIDKSKKQLEEEKESLHKKLQDQKKEVDKLDALLQKLNMASPVSGIILKISDSIPSPFEQSNLVIIPKDHLMCVVAEEEGRLISAKLYAPDASYLKKLDEARVVLQDRHEELKAVVKDILPCDEKDNFLRMSVIVEALGYDALLRPGNQTRIIFLKGSKLQTLSIPLEYLFYKNDKPYCYVKRGDQIIPAAVTTGINDGNDIEILLGLNENEEVILPEIQG